MSGVKAVLLEIDEIVRGPIFESWRRGFVAANVDAFDYSDELKLVYTEIFKRYEEELEAIIARELPPSVDYAQFQRDLPAYLEGPGAQDEATGRAITMLLEAGDFAQFKEMMLFSKRERDEGEMKDSGEDQLSGVQVDQDKAVLAALDVEGMMQTTASLSAAADSGDWTEVLRNDWMSISKMPVPEARRKSKSDIYLKGTWTMNLTFVEAVDMMFSMGDRRKLWDSNFTSCSFPTGGCDTDNDVVTSAALNFGYLVNLVMFGNSSGTNLICKNIRRWNYPREGCVVYAMFPWNVKSGSIDGNHKLLSLKTGSIEAHPTLPGKVVMTTMEINSMGGMPTWCVPLYATHSYLYSYCISFSFTLFFSYPSTPLPSPPLPLGRALNWMMGMVAPSMMKGLEQRYIANIRDKGLTLDLTQNGREKEEGKSAHK